MIAKEYSDGSELTLGQLTAAVIVGGIAGVTIALVKDKLEDRRWEKQKREQRNWVKRFASHH